MELKPSEYWTQAIEELTGEQVMMNTPACVFYKMETHNCKGCSYELNCAKLSNIISIQHHAMNYHPTDFFDHMATNIAVSGMIEDIMSAKTIEEIDAIIQRKKGEK